MKIVNNGKTLLKLQDGYDYAFMSLNLNGGCCSWSIRIDNFTKSEDILIGVVAKPFANKGNNPKRGEDFWGYYANRARIFSKEEGMKDHNVTSGSGDTIT
jgi:hypothetical protein